MIFELLGVARLLGQQRAPVWQGRSPEKGEPCKAQEHKEALRNWRIQGGMTHLGTAAGMFPPHCPSPDPLPSPCVSCVDAGLGVSRRGQVCVSKCIWIGWLSSCVPGDVHL